MTAGKWGVLTMILLVAGGAFAALKAGPMGRQAEIATGYAARVVCACRYVGNRSLNSCKTDLEPGMEIVRLSEDPAAKRITASVPLLAKRTARFDGEFGCALDG